MHSTWPLPVTLLRVHHWYLSCHGPVQPFQINLSTMYVMGMCAPVHATTHSKLDAFNDRLYDVSDHHL